MKRKIIVFIVIVLVIMGVAITSMSVNEAKKLAYTSDGKAIFIPGETDIKDIPKGTPMVIGVIEDNEQSQSDIVNNRQKVKNKVKVVDETQPITEYDVKLEDIEDDPFFKVLLKYNDKEEILALEQKIMEESDGLHFVGEEKEITETELKMYNLIIELMERDDVDENDKKILQEEYLDYADTQKIEKAQLLEE